MRRLTFASIFCTMLGLLLIAIKPGVSNAGRTAPQPVASKNRIKHPLFMSPHFNPIVVSQGLVYVTNTPADTVDVINTTSRQIIKRIDVGISPSGLALRPDGSELWVTNHVSDSVSVVDIRSKSATRFVVVSTIQDFDSAGATRFDEPVGIAFASNNKAYVTLSGENQIAVIDAYTRKIVKRLSIPAQSPRALAVRNGLLYVLPFESGNQTQLSGGIPPLDGNLATFDAYKHSVKENNVLSIGHVVDIVKNPTVPDRDMFVFDTRSDALVRTVNTLGTLLYGIDVDSMGYAVIAQTDARNDINGRAGTKKQTLKELGNRPFLNRITEVAPEAASIPKFLDLESLPPFRPVHGMSLATPYAIKVSPDDRTIVATASGSDVMFTWDRATGRTGGRIHVGAVPEGLALQNSAVGLSKAWVLNAGDDTVSVLDVSRPDHLKLEATIALTDPTDATVKRGRLDFCSARVSSTGTFSCASCHPDANTDQLLWVLKTPVVTGGNQVMPRTTMPVRGLRDTEPFHWDGTLGDPYGGINAANINKKVPANSIMCDPLSSPQYLIDAALSTTMQLESDRTVNDEGKHGWMTRNQRRDLATFLYSVPYPPAQRRSYTNRLSSEAMRGLRLFNIDGDNDPAKERPNVCGDCHRLPFLTSTKTPGTGMDAPTFRGANKRWLILPQGRLNMVCFDFYRQIAERGVPERELWRLSWGGRPRFDPVWNMVLEGSTGFSGAFARQFTLSAATANETNTAHAQRDLITALEQAAQDGSVALHGSGVFLGASVPTAEQINYQSTPVGYRYVEQGGAHRSFTRDALVIMARSGKFVGTFTAGVFSEFNFEDPQPAIWTYGPLQTQRGHQVFPLLYPGSLPMTLSSRHVLPGAAIIVDGRRVDGRVVKGALLNSNDLLTLHISKLLAVGLHTLQVQNPGGIVSDECLFNVAADALSGGPQLNNAVLFGRIDLARNLIQHGANVNWKSEDGNTPLHTAAFLGEPDLLKLLLANGASCKVKNQLGETPLDVVKSDWSSGLTDFYRRVSEMFELNLDLEAIHKTRPTIAHLLTQPGLRN